MPASQRPERRAECLATAQASLTTGHFASLLADLVAVPTESERPERLPDLHRYLEATLAPLYRAEGFDVTFHDNPTPGGGPLLLATRIERADLPTILSYGHGDVVIGMAGKWAEGRAPFTLEETPDRFYGRGSADNKGQHLIGLLALRAVRGARGGKLGFNLKILIETSEEIGSIGLRAFCEAHKDLLAADVLIASDGPRVAPGTPTLCLGHRGVMNFILSVDLRREAHHSGSWGGIIADPAVLLAHAIASISTANGRLNVPEWRPGQLDPAARAALADCPFDPGDAPDRPDPDWGEPGLTQWEKNALWPSFTVLAIRHGDPDAPVNAVQPSSLAYCGLRFPTTIHQSGVIPALQRHLDAAGLGQVRVSDDQDSVDFPATYLDPDTAWVRWAVASMTDSLGTRPQVLPSTGGSLPNDVFTDVLGLETLWLPHSYNSCCQHAPDEHLLKDLVAEGLALMAGLWWDLGEPGVPGPAR